LDELDLKEDDSRREFIAGQQLVQTLNKEDIVKE